MFILKLDYNLAYILRHHGSGNSPSVTAISLCPFRIYCTFITQVNLFGMLRSQV